MTNEKLVFNLGEAAALAKWWLEFNYLSRKREGLLTDDSVDVEVPEALSIKTLKLLIETLEAARKVIWEQDQAKSQFKPKEQP